MFSYDPSLTPNAAVKQYNTENSNIFWALRKFELLHIAEAKCTLSSGND